MSNPIITGLAGLRATLLGKTTGLTVGDTVTLTISPKGGIGPYKIATSGALPSGLIISGSTLTGTVAVAGILPINVIVVDAVGHSVSIPVSLTVAAKSVIVSPPVIDPPLGVPAIVTNPLIAGVQTVGSTLTASSFVFSNSPTDYTYQWKRDGSAISGATTATYALTSADLGHVLTVSMTASNLAGVSAVITSAATNAIVGAIVLPTASANPITTTSLDTGYVDVGSLDQYFTATVNAGPFGIQPYGFYAIFNGDSAHDNSPTVLFSTPNDTTKGFFGVGTWLESQDQFQYSNHFIFDHEWQIGDVIVAIRRANGRVDFTLNGAPITNAVDQDGNAVSPLSYQSVAPAAGQTYFRYKGTGDPSYEPTNIAYGPLSVAQPVTFNTAATTADGRPTAAISYVEPTVAPTGYELQIETLTGTVIQPWSAATIVASSGAGHAVVEGSTAVPTAWEGGNLNLRIRSSTNHTSNDIKTFQVPIKKKYFGYNIHAVSYYDGAGAFKDWMRQMSYTIDGGTYNGLGVNNTGFDRLLADGIIDSYGNLIKWPTGASRVTIGTIRYPEPADIDGDRILRVTHADGTPSSQVITISDAFFGGISFNTSNPQHDPANGVYAITFDPSGNAGDFNIWTLAIDEASFVPNQKFSFRKDGDTSTEIVSDALVNLVRQGGMARFMDIMNANGGGNTDLLRGVFNWGWDEHAMVELCNRAQVNAYMSFGWLQDPADCAAFVGRFRAALDPSLFIVSDSTNEAWGGIGAIVAGLGVKAIYNGRATNRGYGPPIDPAKVHTIPDPDAASAAGVSGGPVTISIPQGEYVLQGINGITSYASLFRAKRTTAPSAVLPTNNGSGLTDNDDFETIVADTGQIAMLEYGVFSYDVAVACKAVDPTFKIFANIGPGDNLLAQNNSAGLKMLTFAKTQGGTDTFASICDGVAVSAYAQPNQADYNNFVAATAGAPRQALIHNAMVSAYADAANIVATAQTGISKVFSDFNRTQAPWTAVYEGGFGSGYFEWHDASTIADLRAYMLSDQGRDDAIAGYEEVFNNGSKSFCMFQIGPASIAGATSLPNYGYFCHFEDLETNTGLAAADFVTGNKYKLLNQG